MEDRDDKLPRLPGQLVVIAIATLVVGLISVLSLVIAFRLGSLWAILFLPLVIPTALQKSTHHRSRQHQHTYPRITPELSRAGERPRRWDDHSASAEAAKRTRLERIVMPLLH